MAGDEILGTAGEAENFIAGKHNRQEFNQGGGAVVHLTAPENFLRHLELSLLRIEAKQDRHDERLGKMERWAESQTERGIVQAERVRNIEGDVAYLKRAQEEIRRAQDESKIHRQQMDGDIKALQQQVSAGMLQINRRVSNIPHETGLQIPPRWQLIGLGILAGVLLLMMVQQLIEAVLQWMG